MKFKTLALAVSASILMTGCFGGRPTSYFLLTPSDESIEPKVAGARSVVLGPVILPSYLDRTNLVTRASENRFIISDLNSWAEPLKDNIGSVLKRNLQRCPYLESVLLFPEHDGGPVRERIDIEFYSFERQANGSVRLDAQSKRSIGETNSMAVNAPISVVLPCSPEVDIIDYDTIALCMSQSLKRVSDEICALYSH